jgi:hypothetical protein
MSGNRRTVGDLYRIALGDGQCGYMQYLGDDRTQLGSNVVRVFSHIAREGAELDLSQIVREPVAFVAHVALPVGVKRSVWEKIGHESAPSKVDTLFCQANDYGQPDMKTSSNWSIWRINEPMLRVGRLDAEQRQAELGLVVNPYDIVSRLRTGRYEFVYPVSA